MAKLYDDRLPIVLVLLDGLGDRPVECLEGMTPSEAASTPHLDVLAARGHSGLHVPFGPGVATSSETAHWSLFGFEDEPFPGRAAIEGLGAGLELPTQTPLFQVALRAGQLRPDQTVALGARARRELDDELAADLFNELRQCKMPGFGVRLFPLRTGEAILAIDGAESHEVSDTDALFDHIHPWMQPLPLESAERAAAAQAVAEALHLWLLEGHSRLCGHVGNAERESRGLEPLVYPVTKWASWLDPKLPSFLDRVGFSGGAVTDTTLYRGFARLLGMAHRHEPYRADDPGRDMSARLEYAEQLLASGCDFVHVHIKATDEAGHRKDPVFKRDLIEAVDEGLRRLLDLADRAVVCVTGDHATPSVGGLLHSGDPTPLMVAGPGILPDAVQRFGEKSQRLGHCGVVQARQVLPLLAGYANRPAFLGASIGPRKTVGLPDTPEPLKIPPQIARSETKQ